MKIGNLIILLGVLCTSLIKAQWINENDFDQYPNIGFESGVATGMHLRGDSLIVLVAIDEFGIASDEWLSCMGVYSPHTGALLDAIVLPNTDSSTGNDLNYWHPTSIGLINRKARGVQGNYDYELEFYDYQLNKFAGIPDFFPFIPNEVDSAFIGINYDNQIENLYWVYPNGTSKYFSDLKRFKDTVESIFGDTNYMSYWGVLPTVYNHKVYLNFFIRPKNSSDVLDVGYIIEVDTNAHILNIKEFSQGGMITTNSSGIFALDWDIDTAGVVFNILRGNSLDSLYHAYTIPQYYIEWLYRTPSYRRSIHIKEKAGHVSLVIYENYIDTTYQNPWQRTRAILYDPSGNEVYNFIVEGNKYKTGNAVDFTLLDDSLNCYILMGDLDGRRLFLAKIGPDGSLGHNETGYGASHTGLEISPNPAKGHIAVQHGLHGKVRYKVYNSAGKVFLNGNMPESSKIDIETLAAGNYWLLVFDDASMLQPKPFVKE